MIKETSLQLGRLQQVLHQRDRWSRQQIEEHQARALQQLRSYAYKHSPFYQRFHHRLTDRPLHELPVLTKALLMEHFDDIVTDRAIHLHAVESYIATLERNGGYLDRYYVFGTSGSAGLRGLAVFSQEEWLSIAASFARAVRDWTNLDANLLVNNKVAGIGSATRWHMSAVIGFLLSHWHFPTTAMDAKKPLEAMVKHLNVWQPGVLIGYPSVINLLAQQQLHGHLQIAPHSVLISAEMLTQDMRSCMQQAWGADVFNLYSTTEAGALAVECDQHQGLHLFEDLVICEVVDESNRPVPAGTYGEKVLVTVLDRRTLPLIRYELSDRIRMLSSSCSCGRSFALIDEVQGRPGELLFFPTLNGEKQAVHPLTLKRLFGAVPCSGWQVIQEPEALRVLLCQVREGFDHQTIVRFLQRELAELGIIVPPIRVELVSAIERGPTGKVVFSKCHV